MTLKLTEDISPHEQFDQFLLVFSNIVNKHALYQARVPRKPKVKWQTMDFFTFVKKKLIQKNNLQEVTQSKDKINLLDTKFYIIN